MVFRIANSVTVIISVLLIFGIFAGIFMYWNQTGRAYKTLQTEEKVIASQAVPMQPTSRVSYIFTGKREAKIEDGKISYFHDDNLGTHSIVTDSSGAITGEFRNFPFGEELSSTGDEKYKYTGKELDDTGLYYYGARYYLPNIGRFTQVDPILHIDTNYAYVNNNPMIMVDPTGKGPVNVIISAPLGQAEEFCKYLQQDLATPDVVRVMTFDQGKLTTYMTSSQLLKTGSLPVYDLSTAAS